MDTQNIPPQPQPQEPVILPPKSKFLPILIVCVFLLLLIVGITAYYLETKQTKTQTPVIPTNPLIPTVVTSPTQSVTIPDEIGKWQTYTNNKSKYEIKYPNDWVLLPDKQDPEEIISLTKDLNSLTIYSGAAYTSIPPNITPTKTKSITIANTNVTQETCANLFEVIKFPNGVSVNNIIIRYKDGAYNQSYEAIFNQILSTFKFL